MISFHLIFYPSFVNGDICNRNQTIKSVGLNVSCFDIIFIFPLFQKVHRMQMGCRIYVKNPVMTRLTKLTELAGLTGLTRMTGMKQK